MLEVFPLPDAGTPPDGATVLRCQGVPPGVRPSGRVLQLVERARAAYRGLARPRALYREVTAPEFERIYRGEGLNADRTPLEEIVPCADRLALFALTLGDTVCREIAALFDRNEPALAAMLDAIASERADHATTLVSAHYAKRLPSRDPSTAPPKVLAYSPGYCGWHVTGQRRLFDLLRPAEIGLSLNPSCLMQPLKSVSGVLVGGPADIHRFDDAYEFCAACTTHACRERIASLADRGSAHGRTGGPE